MMLYVVEIMFFSLFSISLRFVIFFIEINP